MLEKLSRKTNLVLIWIVIGLFVGVSINRAFGGNDPTIVDQRNGNLAVNIANVYQNGLLVPYGNVGIGVVNPAVKLDVNGYVKSTTAFCIGNTCIDENQLKTMLGVGGIATTTLITTSTTSTTASTHKLPPTGITSYADLSGIGVNASIAADTGAFPRQDARYNRPFDYTKIANDGSTLPATATLGTGAKDWACTKDNITGLIWEVKTTSGLRNKDYTYTWYQNNIGVAGDDSTSSGPGRICQTTGRCDTEKFVQDVKATSLCGYSDWRMPTIKELTNIVDFSRNNPPIDPNYFPNTRAALYWSGMGSPSSDSGAWIVDFMGGAISSFGSVDSPRSVRLVHGVIAPTNQFTITDGGLTVTDNSTGLMWKRDFEMNVPGHPVTWEEAHGGQVPFDWFQWGDALKRAINDRTAGYSDWRLPNIKELRSLIDETHASPALDTTAFPAYVYQSSFWSSSPTMDFSYSQALSWNTSFELGQSQATPRNYPQYVRLVRDVTTSP